MSIRAANITLVIAGAIALGVIWVRSPATENPPARVFSQVDIERMQRIINTQGFVCQKPLSMRDMLLSTGFVVKCEGRSPEALYWFNVEDQGGKWIVKSKGFDFD